MNDFKEQMDSIGTIRQDIDKKLEVAVTDINQIAYTIAKLNKQIAAIEVASKEVGDLRDQRDQAVRTLSEYFDLKTYVDNRGQYTVNVEGVGTLVTGGTTQELKFGKRIRE